MKNKEELAKIQAQIKKWAEDEKLFYAKPQKNLLQLQKLHNLRMSDKFNNHFHLAAYSGLINDPNGLAYFENKFHIFYQWSPFLPLHANKYWGHYQTSDFINYHHTGLANDGMTIYEKEGVFSGTALVEQDLHLFWTGNQMLDFCNQNQRQAYTLHGVWSAKEHKIIAKKMLFATDKQNYTGHFRDPKVVKKNQNYYLLHGAQTKNLAGAIAIYHSLQIDQNYQLKGNLQINPTLDNFGYMWECPDLITTKELDLLFFSAQGIKLDDLQNNNRDVPVVLKGKINFDNFEFKQTHKWQVLDYGFDFYAPQMFNQSEKLTLMAWAGIPDSDSLPTINKMWAHNLTLARELTIKNNHLYQKPHPNYQKLRNKLCQALPQQTNIRTFEFIFEVDKAFNFQISNSASEKIEFNIVGEDFVADRSQMTYLQTPNYGLKRKCKLLTPIKKIEIFVDNSLLEIFINDGEFAFTCKYWLTGKLNFKANGFNNFAGYQLKPIKIIDD